MVVYLLHEILDGGQFLPSHAGYHAATENALTPTWTPQDVGAAKTDVGMTSETSGKNSILSRANEWK